MKKAYLTAAIALSAIPTFGATIVDFDLDNTAWSGTGAVNIGNASETISASNIQSWNLSFTFEYVANTSGNAWGSTILSSGADAYANDYSGGFQLRWDNGSSNNDGKIYIKYGDEFAKLNLCTVAYDAGITLKFSLSYDFTGKTLSASVTNDAGEILGSGETSVTSDIIFSQLTNSGSGVSPNEGWAYSELKGSASLIPEPSTFGLLAGLGALAFVVSRRRRSRKVA